MIILWNSERQMSEVSEQERKDLRMLNAGGHPKFPWGKWNSVWKDDEHAQHALYPRRRARACTPGHLQLYSLDSVAGPLLVRDTVDWIHSISKSNSCHDVIWTTKLLEAGKWSWGIIQGIQGFSTWWSHISPPDDCIARTQLEGAPAQLCQHQLGSLGTLNYAWADVRYSESPHDSYSVCFYQCLHNFNIYQHFNFQFINIFLQCLWSSHFGPSFQPLELWTILECQSRGRSRCSWLGWVARMRNTSDLPTLSPWFPCLLEQRFYELNKMRIGMMSLLCMMHLTVLVCSKSCGQRVNGHDFCPLHSGWWLWTVVFLCLGPVWNHFWNQVSAKLSSTRNLRRRPQRLRLSKVGPKAGVELDVTKVGFQKISRFFSQNLR